MSLRFNSIPETTRSRLRLALVRLQPLPLYGGAPEADAVTRTRGWPADRGARLLLFAGLFFFILGFALPSLLLGENVLRIVWVDLLFGVGAGHIEYLPMLFGVFLIPLSVPAALYRHTTALVMAAIGGVAAFALFGAVGFVGPPSRSPQGMLCWLFAGLFMTAGWIVARRKAHARDAEAGKPKGAG
jgi:hypothetical protein